MNNLYVAYAVLLELTYKSYSKRNAHKYFKTEFELRILNQLFKINAYPSKVSKDEISLFLDIPYRSVEVYFQNQRAKLKKSGLATRNENITITFEMIIAIMVNEINK